MRPFHRHPLFWPVVLVAWTIPALFSAGIVVEHSLETGTSIALGRAFLLNAPVWYSWAILTPLVLFLADRLPLAGPRAWRNAALHVPLAFGFALVHVVASTIGLREVIPEMAAMPWRDALLDTLGYAMEYDLMIYGALLAVSHALAALRGSRESEIRQAALEAELAEASLTTLRTRLQPRYLFETLAAIEERMAVDVQDARRLVARLAALLRHTLDAERAREVSLAEELVGLDLYLDVERERLAAPIDLDVIVDDAALEAMVPGLVLQPLAEPAMSRAGDGRAPRRIGIEMRRDGERLVVQVTTDASDGDGEGSDRIAEMRRRIETLYRGAATLEHVRVNGCSGWRLALPYRVASPRVRARHRPLHVTAREGDREGLPI